MKTFHVGDKQIDIGVDSVEFSTAIPEGVCAFGDLHILDFDTAVAFAKVILQEEVSRRLEKLKNSINS